MSCCCVCGSWIFLNPVTNSDGILFSKVTPKYSLIKHTAGLLQLPYIVNHSRWKSFSFNRLIGNCKTFSKIACAIGFGHTRLPSNLKCFPANYSLVLQP